MRDEQPDVIQETVRQWHQSNVRSVLSDVQVYDIAVVQQDLSRKWIIEAANKLNGGRFPTSRRTDNGSKLARFHRQIEASEYTRLRTIGVAKMNISEMELALHMIDLLARWVLGINLGLLVEEFVK